MEEMNEFKYPCSVMYKWKGRELAQHESKATKHRWSEKALQDTARLSTLVWEDFVVE